jgi:hypothetical protein
MTVGVPLGASLYATASGRSDSGSGVRGDVLLVRRDSAGGPARARASASLRYIHTHPAVELERAAA